MAWIAYQITDTDREKIHSQYNHPLHNDETSLSPPRSPQELAKNQWYFFKKAISNLYGWADRRIFDPKTGVMNSKEKEVIKDLNVISMDKLGEKTILHGVEANNPSPENDEKIFVITRNGERFMYGRENFQKLRMQELEEGLVFYENRKLLPELENRKLEDKPSKTST